MRKVLGTSKLSTSNKLTLIEIVTEKLDTKRGDLIIFYEDDDKIVIDKERIEKKSKDEKQLIDA